jgi:ketosteroid isomerase-like protein
MQKHRRFIVLILVIATTVGYRLIAKTEAADAQLENITSQIITREKASYEAWQRKDKTFWAEYLTDDATYFGPDSPYLEVEPKVNLVPKLDKYAEMFKILDFQMYNPHVQVYGDIAILTYNLAQAQSVAGRMTVSTGKITRVYIKQGGTWRAVHTHESVNPRAQ